MFKWFFDIRQSIELEELIGFGKICTFGLQKLSESCDLFLRDCAFGLDGGMDVVNKEVDPEIEL